MLTIENPSQGIALLTLRWKEKRNSLNPDNTREIAAAITTASETNDVLILTGEGAFCSGGDLRAFAEISATKGVEEIRDHVYGDVQLMLRAIFNSPVPVLAAVDGAAVGLGMDLALACDSTLIGPEGWLQQGWARAGLIAGTGGIAMLQVARPKLLTKLLATQDRLGATACDELGLGEIALPTALVGALERALALQAIDREVLRAYMELSRAETWPSPDHFARCAELQAGFIGSERFRLLAAQVLGE